MKWLYIPTFFVLLSVLPQQAQAEKRSFDIKSAVEHALTVNPTIESKLQAIEKAKMDVLTSYSAFLPRASLVWSWSKLENSGGVGTSEDFSNKSRTRGLRTQLSLFAGFAHLNSTGKAFLAVDMEEARHRQARLELIANTQLQFFELFKAREDMKTVQESKKRIEMQLNASKAFVKVGMAPYLNVLQNEVEMSKVNQQEIRVANEIRNAEVEINRYLGYGPEDTIEYVGSLKEAPFRISYTEEEALNVAMNSRPDLIIAQKSVAVALKQSHITAGRYLPAVNVTYDNMRTNKAYTDDDYRGSDYGRRYWTIGMNVSWDFFEGGQTSFAYLADRRAAASLRKDYEDAMAGARTSVIRTLLDIQTSRELITASRKGVEAAKESYAMANRRYQTNTGTITDLVDAQLNLTKAEQDHNLALTEYNSALAKFFYNIGVENITFK